MGDAEVRPHATTMRAESHRGERNARINTLRVKPSRSLARILLASPRRGGRVQRSQSPFSPRNLHGKPCDGGGESHLAGGAEVLRERNHELLRGNILHGAGSVRHVANAILCVQASPRKGFAAEGNQVFVLLASFIRTQISTRASAVNFRSMRLTSHITHVNYLTYDFEFKMRNVTGNRCVPIAKYE